MRETNALGSAGYENGLFTSAPLNPSHTNIFTSIAPSHQPLIQLPPHFNRQMQSYPCQFPYNSFPNSHNTFSNSPYSPLVTLPTLQQVLTSYKSFQSPGGVQRGPEKVFELPTQKTDSRGPSYRQADIPSNKTTLLNYPSAVKLPRVSGMHIPTPPLLSPIFNSNTRPSPIHSRPSPIHSRPISTPSGAMLSPTHTLNTRPVSNPIRNDTSPIYNPNTTQMHIARLPYSDPVGFTCDMLPIPCAFLRLPWPTDKCYIRLMPSDQDAINDGLGDKRGNGNQSDVSSSLLRPLTTEPHFLIVKRMFVERIADSPSVYLIRYVFSPLRWSRTQQTDSKEGRNSPVIMGGPMNDENLVHLLFLRSQDLFAASNTVGLGFSTSSVFVSHIHRKQSEGLMEADVCVFYFRW